LACEDVTREREGVVVIGGSHVDCGPHVVRIEFTYAAETCFDAGCPLASLNLDKSAPLDRPGRCEQHAVEGVVGVKLFELACDLESSRVERASRLKHINATSNQL